MDGIGENGVHHHDLPTDHLEHDLLRYEVIG